MCLLHTDLTSLALLLFTFRQQGNYHIVLIRPVHLSSAQRLILVLQNPRR
jgi:hypothetical protein